MEEAEESGKILKEKSAEMLKAGRILKEENAEEQNGRVLNNTSETGKILVYIDHRERNSGVIEELAKKENIEIEQKQLEVGDFILAKEVIVERKTVDDFLNSLIDGRLFGQLPSLSTCCEKPLMVVEGFAEELYSTRNIHENAVNGALTSIMLDFRTPVLFTRSARETADRLYLIAKREQSGKPREISLRRGKKGFTLAEMQRFVVESFPSVGPNTAKKLLKKFGSIKNIANARSEELRKIDVLGQKKAAQIKRVLAGKYKEEKE